MALEPKPYEGNHWCPDCRFSGASARNPMATSQKLEGFEFRIHGGNGKPPAKTRGTLQHLKAQGFKYSAFAYLPPSKK